eukprot:TRINITY_DN2095_c0_g2_i1.p2 TRINITY_DN2095_c0_g2~~TRINITY_DN2095_c0_g2_i1.p2  ORF type:complete len:209 (-),score=4.64 TRINITY_DN2095_c0_g2_i1:184-810(-)
MSRDADLDVQGAHVIGPAAVAPNRPRRLWATGAQYPALLRHVTYGQRPYRTSCGRRVYGRWRFPFSCQADSPRARTAARNGSEPFYCTALLAAPFRPGCISSLHLKVCFIFYLRINSYYVSPFSAIPRRRRCRAAVPARAIPQFTVCVCVCVSVLHVLRVLRVRVCARVCTCVWRMWAGWWICTCFVRACVRVACTTSHRRQVVPHIT